MTEKIETDKRGESPDIELIMTELLSRPTGTKFQLVRQIFNHGESKIDRPTGIAVDVDGSPCQKNVDIKNKKSFHTAIGKIITTAQIFGLMPLRGVLAQNPDQLKFTFFSVRVIYSSLLLLCLVFIEVLCLKFTLEQVEKQGPKFLGKLRHTIVGSLFYGNALTATLLFLKLASRWPNLMAEWYRTDQIFQKLPYIHLSRKFSIITATVMIPALCEHILSILSNIPEYIHTMEAHEMTPPCPNEINFRVNISSSFNAAQMLKVYSCRSQLFIFTTVNYNIYFAIILIIGSRLATFIWNFTDLFIALVSIGLTEHFVQFNHRIEKTELQVIGQEEWQKLRQHYNQLSLLTKAVDKEISGIVFLSCINNLCFICLQLATIVDSPYKIDKIYFFVSFAFLLGRTVLVTLSAAQINEESRASLHYLFVSPSGNYCTEMVRLQTQITTDEISLTGLKIFPITRNFMLVMTGCIITYEVVLLQFHLS